MVERAPFYIFKPDPLTEEQATRKLAISLPGCPPEVFKYIEFEDVVSGKYFITSYGRVFNTDGRELFPEEYHPPKENNIYLRIELSCSTYIKRRKFFVHRLVANAFIPKTQEDIQLNRDLVNHKFNKDGRCNFVWNLEWANDSENTLHGLYFEDTRDDLFLDQNEILNRKELYISYNQDCESNPNSRITSYQARLICHAYKNLHYSLKESAYYAGLDGTDKDAALVSSIVNGYCWTSVSGEFGIEPKAKRKKIKRATPIREEKVEEYNEIRSQKRR